MSGSPQHPFLTKFDEYYGWRGKESEYFPLISKISVFVRSGRLALSDWDPSGRYTVKRRVGLRCTLDRPVDPREHYSAAIQHSLGVLP